MTSYSEALLEKHTEKSNPFSPFNKEIISELEDELPTDIIDIIISATQDDDELSVLHCIYPDEDYILYETKDQSYQYKYVTRVKSQSEKDKAEAYAAEFHDMIDDADDDQGYDMGHSD
jgi:hypothetical protein